MRTNVCDWCNRAKKNGARWILGFAAERVSRAGVQREISIEPAWSEKRAEHPLASVHFCSEAHKDFYVAALFRNHRSASPLRDSAGPTSRRVCHSETSTAMGAVSIQTDFKTEEFPPRVPQGKTYSGRGNDETRSGSRISCSHLLGLGAKPATNGDGKVRFR
jgi:hypothetical protein